MREVAERALGLVPGSVDYADVRVVRRRHQCVHADGEHVEVVDEESEGIGVRVLLGGEWGFAAAPRFRDLDVLVRRALGQARAAGGRGRARLAPSAPQRARWRTPVARDPFSVPVSERVALLQPASVAGREAAGRWVRASEASMDCFEDEKVLATTDGTLVEQRITETGAGLLVTVSDGNEVQRRSYPQSVPRAIRGQRGDFATAGWEHVERMGLIEEAPRVGAEAAALLAAPPCPPMTTTLIVSSSQMALVLHETIGHATELDRALGSEASLAGGTYASPGRRGRFRVGTELLNAFADARLERGVGSFGFDDEGVPAQRTELVRDGVFVGYMSAREGAAALDVAPSGAARADGWQRVPLVRMTNVCLAPSSTSFDDMIAGVEDGVLVDMNRSLSIDDRRMSFRFGSEIAWEIRGGKLGRVLKNCSFTGVTPSFWASCDAIGDAASWRLWGLPSCNKGDPLQVAHVGHGTVPARFRDAQVGP